MVHPLGLLNHGRYVETAFKTRKESEDVQPRYTLVRRDYYGVLGVSPSASDEEIKRAYRRLAMEHGLSAEILDRLTWFLKYLKQRPECLEDFHREWQDAADAESK